MDTIEGPLPCIDCDVSGEECFGDLIPCCQMCDVSNGRTHKAARVSPALTRYGQRAKAPIMDWIWRWLTK